MNHAVGYLVQVSALIIWVKKAQYADFWHEEVQKKSIPDTTPEDLLIEIAILLSDYVYPFMQCSLVFFQLSIVSKCGITYGAGEVVLSCVWCFMFEHALLAGEAFSTEIAWILVLSLVRTHVPFVAYICTNHLAAVLAHKPWALQAQHNYLTRCFLFDGREWDCRWLISILAMVSSCCQGPNVLHANRTANFEYELGVCGVKDTCFLERFKTKLY